MILLYKCSYCLHDTIFKNRKQCVNHELECSGNPQNKTCDTCKHLRYNFEPDETWTSCEIHLKTYKENSRGDLMIACEGWEKVKK